MTSKLDPDFIEPSEAVDSFQLPAVVPELPRDRIVRRIIDVFPLVCCVTSDRHVITTAILHLRRSASYRPPPL